VTLPWLLGIIASTQLQEIATLALKQHFAIPLRGLPTTRLGSLRRDPKLCNHWALYPELSMGERATMKRMPSAGLCARSFPVWVTPI
jgi:hypothetical protein